MTDEKKPQAKIIETKRVYDGFFKMDELTIEMDRHEGGTMTLKRLNFERGHAVAMLGYDPKRDEVLLVNEMRPGMLVAGDYPFVDALPAGMIDKDEDAITAAVRELHEETGVDLKSPRLIHDGAYVSSGGTSEKISLVVGLVDMTQAGGIHGKPGEGENIKTVVISGDEFIQRAEDGRLQDMKSLVCAFWLAKHRDELRLSVEAKPANDGPRKKAGGMQP
ncbi:MAG: NUDIX domain-containing protein [Micavibrio sp.]|nr:NUDIX domain-containing protein [Micavibrio sp.]